jgi:hypothetical protein
MANTGINVKIRDTAETAGVLAANYFLPGSSLLTGSLASKGSQEQLNSDVGRIAQLATAGTGVFKGNLANYGKLYDMGTNAIGLGDSAPAAVPGSTPTAATGAPAAAGSAPAASSITASQAVAMSVMASAYLAPKMPDIPSPPEPLPPPQMSKTPDATSYLNTMSGMGQAGGQAGIAQTLLTGSGGVDPNKLKSRKTTLLGA